MGIKSNVRQDDIIHISLRENGFPLLAPSFLPLNTRGNRLTRCCKQAILGPSMDILCDILGEEFRIWCHATIIHDTLRNTFTRFPIIIELPLALADNLETGDNCGTRGHGVGCMV